MWVSLPSFPNSSCVGLVAQLILSKVFWAFLCSSRSCVCSCVYGLCTVNIHSHSQNSTAVFLQRSLICWASPAGVSSCDRCRPAFKKLESRACCTVPSTLFFLSSIVFSCLFMLSVYVCGCMGTIACLRMSEDNLRESSLHVCQGQREI